MAAVYPTSIKSYTTKTNKVDVYDASHVNDLQSEVVALQTYIGTNPHGSAASLSARFSAMHNSSGYLISSAGVPQPTSPGMIYYDTSADVMKLIKSDKLPYSVGGSLTNVVFCWAGVEAPASIGSCAFGIISSPTLFPTAGGANWFSFAISGTDGFLPLFNFKYKKLADQSYLDLHARLWSSSAALNAVLMGSISTVSGTMNSAGAVAPAWATTCVLNVSSLTTGTVYDGSIQFRHSNTIPNGAYCSAVMLIAR